MAESGRTIRCAIEVPEGPITVEGTRRNARMLIEYVEGWLSGRGAKGIDSLAGKPGMHPALMEDLATGRMSVAQIAQRIRHAAQTTEGPAAAHDFALVKRLLQEELDDILRLRGRRDAETQERYRKAVKIALRWIKNYTELDFRSLGSYTRADLERSPPRPTPCKGCPGSHTPLPRGRGHGSQRALRRGGFSSGTSASPSGSRSAGAAPADHQRGAPCPEGAEGQHSPRLKMPWWEAIIRLPKPTMVVMPFSSTPITALRAISGPWRERTSRWLTTTLSPNSTRSR